ncbi:hypothetical protein MAGR_64790 [Mycolicibacterium agri]|uniref:Transposase IS110-like N-terminal domain-containing protein n=1 Tax=Mycolicibacterium agri TaxID=36811 RepID=A0A7I9WCJ8_MYCAG|nr:hypothetical protein MAGR_64790 [Mycolicibacterium agri]
MRRDLQPLRAGDEIAVDLRILTARRIDLVADRTRAINRLRAQLEYFPALERAFDYGHSKAALILLTGYQTPDAPVALESHAWKPGCANARPTTLLPLPPRRSQPPTPNTAPCPATDRRGDGRAAGQGGDGLDTEIGDTETMIEDRFRRHRHAEIILSMPGFGVQLGAEFSPPPVVT